MFSSPTMFVAGFFKFLDHTVTKIKTLFDQRLTERAWDPLKPIFIKVWSFFKMLT